MQWWLYKSTHCFNGGWNPRVYIFIYIIYCSSNQYDKFFLEPQTTIYTWMFGETTIFHIKIWNHPIETSIYKWLFGVPGNTTTTSTPCPKFQSLTHPLCVFFVAYDVTQFRWLSTAFKNDPNSSNKRSSLRYSSWSNYSDLTRPRPIFFCKLRKGSPLISGKSRLVNYCHLG